MQVEAEEAQVREPEVQDERSVGQAMRIEVPRWLMFVSAEAYAVATVIVNAAIAGGLMLKRMKK